MTVWRRGSDNVQGRCQGNIAIATRNIHSSNFPTAVSMASVAFLAQVAQTNHPGRVGVRLASQGSPGIAFR